MKTPFASYLLLVLVPLGGCTAPVQSPVAHKDYVTDLDCTVETEFEVNDFGGRQRLRSFAANNAQGLSDPYIFGEYRTPMDLTGGHNLHVFPDGCFVIEEFCDVGPSATVASGHWRLDGNTLVVSDVVDRNSASAVLGMQWVKEHFGNPERLLVFLTADGESIGETLLVAEDTASNGPRLGLKYVRRITQYVDWAKRQQDLLKD